jgi:hypothetical protein
MIDTAFAERFAHEWVEAWNSSDLHFVLDSVFVGADSIALTYTSCWIKRQ